MPAPLAKGIIITVSVILAAGLAAYENPHVRQWIDQSRQKIAMALHSLGDDIYPRSRSPPRDDPSMREDTSEVAEERRRQARAEIMERGRIMEERRRRKSAARKTSDPNTSFDGLVDNNGKLRSDAAQVEASEANTTAVEPMEMSDGLINRHQHAPAADLHASIDSPIALRQLDPRPLSTQLEEDPFASLYEREMRDSWNLPLPQPPSPGTSTHPSESLIDLTPTSEAPPDPELSVPDANLHHTSLGESQYFSAGTSASSPVVARDVPEFYYAHPSNPSQPIPPVTLAPDRAGIPVSVSSAPSIAGSVDHVHASELDDSEDGIMSEFGDGIHTPASAWTEVGSVTSSDAGN